MGTIFEIHVYCLDQKSADAAMDLACEITARLESIFNMDKPDSDISKTKYRGYQESVVIHSELILTEITLNQDL